MIYSEREKKAVEYVTARGELRREWKVERRTPVLNILGGKVKDAYADLQKAVEEAP